MKIKLLILIVQLAKQVLGLSDAQSYTVHPTSLISKICSACNSVNIVVAMLLPGITAGSIALTFTMST